VTERAAGFATTNRDFGLDADRVTPAEPIPTALRRRLAGRYPVDPFGLDPQLCDLSAPIVESLISVQVENAERIPSVGPAALVANRGLGVTEPAALAVAVRKCTQRRLRVVGAPNLAFVGGFSRRFGAVGASAEDVASTLRAGHLVAVPLSPTWLRTGAGTPPLALVQAMMEVPVIPVAVRASGPFGTPVRWQVTIGEPCVLDHSYAPGDPLGAAELGEAVRAAVGALLRGEPVDAAPAAAVNAW
jgi:hypothetical protein